MNEPDNPMISPCYHDEPTVGATDPCEVKYLKCERCGDRTAEADLNGEGVCDICREEMEEKNGLKRRELFLTRDEPRIYEQ